VGGTNAGINADSSGIYALYADVNNVYAGGDFTNANGKMYVARYSTGLDVPGIVKGKNGMTVYPNPVVNGFITIAPDMDINEGTLTVFNAVGMAVLQQTLHGVTHQAKQQLDIRSLPAGSYMVQLQTGTQHAINRFIKE